MNCETPKAKVRSPGDAILDRLVHSAHKIHLEGESIRKRKANNKNTAKSLDQAPSA